MNYIGRRNNLPSMGRKWRYVGSIPTESMVRCGAKPLYKFRANRTTVRQRVRIPHCPLPVMGKNGVGVMPKEIIFVGPELVDIEGIGEEFASETRAHLDRGHKVGLPYQRAIVVRWGKDNGHLEIGVAKVGLADNAESEQHYTQSMTRQEINRLIQVARQARDGAHGRDQ